MTESVICKKIWISGRVQGVFFRASAMQQAMGLGLVGFVKNETDGKVFIEVQGASSRIDKLIEWSKEGPQFARVDSVEVSEANIGEFDRFEIRH